jgi:xylan 1,4-beta-xylosidase
MEDDGWLYLEHGGVVPRVEVESPDKAAMPRARQAVKRDFAKVTELPAEFQWLRTPHPERLFTLTGSALRLFGRESVGSWFEQSLVARRQEDFAFRAETSVTFNPQSYQQAAGLTHYYNRYKFHLAAVTWHETLGRVLTLMSCLADYPESRYTFHLADPIALAGTGPVSLAADVTGPRSATTRAGLAPRPGVDASVISDEGGRGAHGSFTGAFIGMSRTTSPARPARPTSAAD